MKEMNTRIWRNGKVIGQCYMTSKIRETLNTTQSSFYFDSLFSLRGNNDSLFSDEKLGEGDEEQYGNSRMHS